jgi:hypothetical protein
VTQKFRRAYPFPRRIWAAVGSTVGWPKLDGHLARLAATPAPGNGNPYPNLPRFIWGSFGWSGQVRGASISLQSEEH